MKYIIWWEKLPVYFVGVAFFCDVKKYKILTKKTPLSGKLIMFTGNFEDKSRSELKSLAESLGAKIVSNISKFLLF